MPYPHLSSPGRIGGVTLKNRIAMTAASASLSEPDGSMTEAMLAYYEARAKGGVGLIITEMVCVDEQRGVLFPRELNAARDENIPDFRALADRLHPYGTKVFAQLFHPGANADPKLNPLPLVSASAGRGKKRGQAEEASRETIHTIVEHFGQAAHRVQQAGFDGIEIHAAHHYFLHSFLSPVTNHRTDEYGGSLEHRARILQEVVQSIRAHCGPDFPVMVRVSLEEYIGPKGYHADTGLKLCQMLESWGVDALNVSASGTDSKGSQSVEPMPYRQGWRKHLPWLVKQTVSIPVLAVALIRDPAFAEQLLADGVLDFAASARSHLADPNWANKAFAGQEADILPCISCMACFSKFDGEGHITCAVNPCVGRETELTPAAVSKRVVVVVGGGPGGLYAAWISALRGHQVTLLEKGSELGGNFRIASFPTGKGQLSEAIRSLIVKCRKAGVDLRTEAEATEESLKALAPEAIILATGSTPLVLPIPGLADCGYVTAQDMLEAVQDTLPETDILIKAAAVADYRPANVAEDKMKKKDGDLSIPLERTQDILGWVAENRHPGLFVCGFSMETKDMIANSQAKLERKKLDMIVANNLKVAGARFGVSTNVVTLITKDGLQELPRMGKDEVAAHLLDEIQRRR